MEKGTGQQQCTPRPPPRSLHPHQAQGVLERGEGNAGNDGVPQPRLPRHVELGLGVRVGDGGPGPQHVADLLPAVLLLALEPQGRLPPPHLHGRQPVLVPGLGVGSKGQQAPHRLGDPPPHRLVQGRPAVGKRKVK